MTLALEAPPLVKFPRVLGNWAKYLKTPQTKQLYNNLQLSKKTANNKPTKARGTREGENTCEAELLDTDTTGPTPHFKLLCHPRETFDHTFVNVCCAGAPANEDK